MPQYIGCTICTEGQARYKCLVCSASQSTHRDHLLRAEHDLPLLEVLTIQYITDLRFLEVLLPVFRGQKLRALVISPAAKLYLGDKPEDSVRRLLRVIDKTFPSLSVLGFSAYSLRVAYLNSQSRCEHQPID